MTDERITYEPYSGPDGSYIIATATLAEITPQKADGPTRAKATEALCLVLIDLCDVLYADDKVLGCRLAQAERERDEAAAQGFTLGWAAGNEDEDNLQEQLAALRAENAVLKESLRVARQDITFAMSLTVLPTDQDMYFALDAARDHIEEVSTPLTTAYAARIAALEEVERTAAVANVALTSRDEQQHLEAFGVLNAALCTYRKAYPKEGGK